MATGTLTPRLTLVIKVQDRQAYPRLSSGTPPTPTQPLLPRFQAVRFNTPSYDIIGQLSALICQLVKSPGPQGTPPKSIVRTHHSHQHISSPDDITAPSAGVGGAHMLDEVTITTIITIITKVMS